MMKKIINIIYIVIVAFVLLVNICSMFNVSFLGFRLFRVASGSMEPTINLNALIIIHNQKDYQKGDIITYKDSSSYTTHRIVDISDDLVITKGDANDIKDVPISKDLIIGKVIYTINLSDKIVYLFNRYIVWVILLLALILIIVNFPISRNRIEQTRSINNEVINDYKVLKHEKERKKGKHSR